MSDIDTIKMDKTHFSTVSLYDEPDEKHYWRTKTPQDRLATAGILRQIAYGYDPATERLQRLFETIECSWS